MDNITIAVDKGKFRSIQEAAEAQKQIDWSDESSADVRTCTECFGAVDLLRHMKKIAPDTIVELGTEVPKTGDVIVIGILAEKLRKQNLESLEQEGFLIQTCCENGRRITYFYSKTRAGILYAIDSYLEQLGIRWFSPSEHGTYIPNIQTFRIPEIQLQQAPSFKTRACYSELLDDSEDAFLDWLMHKKVNLVYLEKYENTENLKKRGIRICKGGHSILHKFFSPDLPYPYNHPYSWDEKKPDDPYVISHGAAPAKEQECFTYFHAHPEWYGLIDGKRSKGIENGTREGFGDNFCTSNTDAVSELCKNIVASLIDGELSDTDYLNFWMLDNGRWCQCEQCKRLGNETRKLCLVVYQLSLEIKKALKDGRLKREITILFPAYHETLPLPDLPLPDDFDYEHCIATYFPIERCYVHHLNDPACTETNCYLFKEFMQWAPITESTYQGELAVGEYFNVSSFSSISTSFQEKIAYDIPFYYENGVRHMYFMHMIAKEWGALSLTNGLFYSLLWNVKINAENYKREFCRLYYKEVSDIMEPFYALLEQGSSNMKYFKHYQYLYDEKGKHRQALFAKLNQMELSEEDIFPLKHMQYDEVLQDSNAGISVVQMMECYDQCRKLLEKARYECTDEITAARLEEDTMRFEYTYDSLRYLFHMSRLAIFHAKGKKMMAQCEYQIAAKYAGQLKNTTRPLEGLLHFEFYRDGLGATWAEEAFEKYSRVYGGENI